MDNILKKNITYCKSMKVMLDELKKTNTLDDTKLAIGELLYTKSRYSVTINIERLQNNTINDLSLKINDILLNRVKEYTDGSELINLFSFDESNFKHITEIIKIYNLFLVAKNDILNKDKNISSENKKILDDIEYKWLYMSPPKERFDLKFVEELYNFKKYHCYINTNYHENKKWLQYINEAMEFRINRSAELYFMKNLTV